MVPFNSQSAEIFRASVISIKISRPTFILSLVKNKYEDSIKWEWIGCLFLTAGGKKLTEIYVHTMKKMEISIEYLHWYAARTGSVFHPGYGHSGASIGKGNCPQTE